MNVRVLLLAILPVAAVAGGNWFVVARLLGVQPLDCVPCAAWFIGGPLLLTVVLLAFLRPTAATRPAAPPPPPPPPSLEEGALRLLGLLQEEGRLVDFLEEDVTPYDDEQIGAATRGIHEACRKALHERITVEPILAGAEGDTVEVKAGFDPAEIRLVGNVTGTAPLKGVLRHGGWRVKRVAIAPRQGQDHRVIAPAEVEIG
jgi:hypothetical protein